MEDWFALWSAVFQLGLESNEVITSRMRALAAGGGGAREVTRMVSEKGEAWQAAALIALASSAEGRDLPIVLGRVVRSYRKSVRRNRRRLG
jgi:hypothetical protein